MSEKEPEVVHLEWERVEDPERDPPPELVVAEPKAEPLRPRIIPRASDPNPIGRPGYLWATILVYGLGFIAWHLLMRAAGLLGN